MPDQTEEQIRKVFVKDVKVGADVHTVFKAVKKAKVTARSGKVFLSLTLVDKTGELDARVFDNIDAAEGAFTEGDYLLVKGRTIAFHGKPQLVLDTIERLDPGPIDPEEFAYVAPPPEAKPERAERPERPERTDKSGRRHRLLLAALEDERVLEGLDAFFKHLDAYIEDRVQARLQSALSKERGQGGGKPKEHRERDNHRESKPKVEHKAEPKAEAARDPGLPKELSFKPFSMLTQAPAEPKPAENSSKPDSGS